MDFYHAQRVENQILHLIALARKHYFGLPQAKQENKNRQVFDPQLMCPYVPDVV